MDVLGRARGLRASAAAGLLVLLLAGCADGETTGTTGPGRSTAPGAPSGSTQAVQGLATYPATGEGSDGASLEGILERRDGCLVVVAPPVGTGDDTERVVLPVFPAPSATVVDGAVEWNGHRAEIGGQVGLTGGYLGPGRIEDPMFRVPEECAWATGDGFIVGNV